MTTQILSRKARISAVITALVMMLTALWTARPTLASADVWDDGEFCIDYSHVCTDDCYKNIYYLTDNAYAEYYVNSFLGGLADMYAEQHTAFNEFKYYDTKAIYRDSWRESVPSQERFGESIDFFHLDSIKNALVIYEINDMMPLQFSDGMPYMPTYELYDRFLKFKRNNCRILFICNTDELNFNDEDESNRFLDLVDVHINTDIYSSFVETFLTEFTEGPVSGTTIILDRSLCPYSVQGFAYKENEYKRMYERRGQRYGSRYEFLDGMLIPRIREVSGQIRSGFYPDNRYLLDDQRINILCYIGNGLFYDIGGDCVYSWENDDRPFYDRYYGESYYFVGSTRNGSNLTELRELLIEIEYEAGTEGMFQKYMFVEYGSYSSVDGESNMIAAGRDNRRMASFIAPIVARFLFDDIYEVDWDSINNWPGRCDVTVKPTSADTWLLPLSDPADTIGEIEEREYYDDLY